MAVWQKDCRYDFLMWIFFPLKSCSKLRGEPFPYNLSPRKCTAVFHSMRVQHVFTVHELDVFLNESLV